MYKLSPSGISKNGTHGSPMDSASGEGRAQDFPTELRPWNAFWQASSAPCRCSELLLWVLKPPMVDVNREPHDRSYEQNGPMDR